MLIKEKLNKKEGSWILLLFGSLNWFVKRRVKFLIKKRKKKYWNTKKNFFLTFLPRVFKIKRVFRAATLLPFSFICLYTYPDKTVKAATRVLVKAVPFTMALILKFAIAHNGIRLAKQPRK